MFTPTEQKAVWRFALTITVLLLCVLVDISEGASNTGSGDPRCPVGYDPMQHCPSSMILPGGAGFDTTRNIDPTSCNDQENCPRCLGDDAWQQKMINEIGLYSAVRDVNFKPWVHIDNWLSLEITSTIAMLLLRDTMNISARAATMYTNGNVDYICCSEPILNVEQWATGGTFLNDTAQGTLTDKPNGYTGQSGLFVPPYTIEKYPLAFTYQAYRLLPDYQHIFPPSFSTACSNMTVNSATGCVSGNYVCETNLWTNTTCYDGQWYVPPQCNVAGEVGNSSATHCQEVIMADPTYDAGIIEGMIKNNGLNMTGAYVGLGRHGTIVRDKVARKEDFIFYWYIPDPLVVEVNGKMIDFEADTDACVAERSTDPTLNTAKCGFPALSLKKRVRTDALSRDVDFKFFFDNFQLTASQLDALLLSHTSAGGNYSVYDLSCNWLKNNFDTWKGMVQNTPPTAALTDSSASNVLNNKGILAAVIIGSVAVCALVLGLVLWICCRHRLSLRNAPRTAPLAMIFTDIESSTMLWETLGDDMGTAVEIHHAIIRKHIEEFNAYEVKTIGDSFMIACNSLGDATMLCLAIQTSLGDCKDLPAALRFDPDGASDVRTNRSRSVADSVQLFDSSMSVGGGDGGGGEIASDSTTPPATKDVRKTGFYYPLRVRIGLHWCQEVNPRFDRIHGRYDYYGHDVNVCARVEAQALGAQIVVTSETMDAIMSTDDYPLMIAPEISTGIFRRNVELKGVSNRVVLYGIAPKSIVASGYASAKLLREPSYGRRSTGHRSMGGLLYDSTSEATAGVSEMGTVVNSRFDNRQFFASRNYTTALFRASFKAVPESGKAVWLASLAKVLKVEINKNVASDRAELTKQFELLKLAVEDNCLVSVSATMTVVDESNNGSPDTAVQSNCNSDVGRYSQE